MSYFDKFTINLQKAIKVSSEAAKHFGSSYIGSEHILFGILNVPECRACKLLKAAGVNEGAYRAVFVRSLDKNTKVAGFTPRTKNMFERACEFALCDGAGAMVGTEHMLLAILDDEDSIAFRILKMLGADISGLVSALDEEIGFSEEDTDVRDEYSAPTFIRFSAEPYAANPAAAQNGARAEKGPLANFKFGTDLTQKAREGKIDPVIGRKKEIDKIIQV